MEEAAACWTACVMDGWTLDMAASAVGGALCRSRVHVVCAVCLCVEARSSPTSSVVCLGNGILGGPGKEVSVYHSVLCTIVFSVYVWRC